MKKQSFMLDLETSDKNLMIINEERFGVKIGLYYKDPTPEEYLNFKSLLVKRVIERMPANELIKMQITESMKYLTGVREGDLGVGNKGISTDKKNENYRKDWKELLYKKAYKILLKYSETLLGDYSTTVVKDENRPLV